MIKSERITFLIAILFLFSLTACDGSGGNNDAFCSFDEFIENFANTDCLAEELVEAGCRNAICSGTNVRQGNLNEFCTVIDCATLECERIKAQSGETNVFMTDLTFDELTGRPIGVFQFDDMEVEFSCTVFVR